MRTHFSQFVFLSQEPQVLVKAKFGGFNLRNDTWSVISTKFERARATWDGADIFRSGQKRHGLESVLVVRSDRRADDE